MGWVPEVNIARPRGVTHVHTDTVVRVVMGPWRSPDFVSGSAGWQIDADGSAEFNDITARGTITATAGEIGGWTIEAGHLYAGSGANRVGLKPGSYPFYAGAEAEASAPFRVSKAGEVWATNAHVTGEIDANSGHLGTLDVDGVITVGTGTPVIQIDGPNKRIRTSDFVSGQKGWEVTHEGKAEFDNLFVRGELHACVFVADEMHATGGTLAVMTVAKVAEPSGGANKLPFAIGYTFNLVLQGSWDTGACYVADDDVLRIKTMAAVAAGGSLDLWDIWLEVNGTPSSRGDRDLSAGNPGSYNVAVYWRQGGETDLVIPTGAAAIVWGHIGSEEGGLVLTSDLNYSPYMDIFTIPSATPWSSGTTPHVRVGNLDGVLGLGEEWGIAAGTDLSDATKGHVVLSDQRVRLWGVAQRWWDTSGNIRGQIDPLAGDSDVLFWLGPSEAGAHFKVLGSGDVWLDTLAISGDLGSFLFSKGEGLLLLGPNCEINATEWWSLRREKATISGAFHQEAGRWLGTRGLRVEKAGFNYELAPRMIDSDASGVADGWGMWDNFGSGGSPTTTVVAHPLAERGWLQRFQYTGAAGDVNDFCMLYDYTATGSFAQGDDVTVSLDAKGTLSGCVFKIVLQEADAASVGGTVHTGSNLTVSSGIQRFQETFTLVDADCSKVRVRLTVSSVDDGDTLDIYVGAVNVEKKMYATTFCCGALDWCSWSGTADASTSSRTVTEVNLDDLTRLISQVHPLSIHLWVQMPYDADATWPNSGGNSIFDARGAAGNQISVVYMASSDQFWVYLNDDYHLKSGNQTFKAGDWIAIGVKLDYLTDHYRLYLNGEEVDNYDAGLNSPTITDWEIGSAAGGYQGGFTLGEIAVVNVDWSANDFAAIYALQRPLVDAGAMDSPGIYILDGKFKMASSLTGNRIEMDAEEIAGYGSGGTKQFYLRASDGAAYAGGGVVRLNADGLQIVADSAAGDPEKIRFLYDNSGSLRRQGSVYSDWGGGGSDPNITWVQARRVSGDPWPAGVQVVLIAHDTVVGTDVRIAVNSNKVVDVTGEEIFKTEKLLRPGTGTSDPTAQVEDGCLFYRTDTDKLRLRANGAWVDLN
jgi:hypothetical protein